MRVRDVGHGGVAAETSVETAVAVVDDGVWDIFRRGGAGRIPSRPSSRRGNVAASLEGLEGVPELVSSYRYVLFHLGPLQLTKSG